MAFGTESATPRVLNENLMGNSRGGARCSGRRCATKMKENDLCSNYLCSIRIQRRRLAPKVRPGEARFGPELDGVKPWPGCARKMEENYLVSQDPEAAFSTESATGRSSFGTRIRWGKAVAAPGLRGQDAREKLKNTVFVL